MVPNMRLTYLLAVAPFVLLAVPTAENPLERHTATLQMAQSLTVNLKVNVIGGEAEEEELVFSAGNKAKWETPSKLILTDGKIGVTYDKKSKTYVQETWSKTWARKAFGSDRIYPWTAFQNNEFGRDITASKSGESRQVQTMKLTDVKLTRMRKTALTVMIDATSGLVHGLMFEDKDAVRTVVQASELKVDSKPLPDSTFAWVVPAGASEKPIASAEPVLYASIKGILDGSCGACHGSTNPKGRIDLSSYEAIMASNVVKPGDPDNSRLVRAITFGKMPPKNPMPNEPVEKLTQWVKDGAKQ